MEKNSAYNYLKDYATQSFGNWKYQTPRGDVLPQNWWNEKNVDAFRDWYKLDETGARAAYAYQHHTNPRFRKEIEPLYGPIIGDSNRVVDDTIKDRLTPNATTQFANGQQHWLPAFFDSAWNGLTDAKNIWDTYKIPGMTLAAGAALGPLWRSKLMEKPRHLTTQVSHTVSRWPGFNIITKHNNKLNQATHSLSMDAKRLRSLKQSGKKTYFKGKGRIGRLGAALGNGVLNFARPSQFALTARSAGKAAQGFVYVPKQGLASFAPKLQKLIMPTAGTLVPSIGAMAASDYFNYHHDYKPLSSIANPAEEERTYYPGITVTGGMPISESVANASDLLVNGLQAKLTASKMGAAAKSLTGAVKSGLLANTFLKAPRNVWNGFKSRLRDYEGPPLSDADIIAGNADALATINAARNNDSTIISEIVKKLPDKHSLNATLKPLQGVWHNGKKELGQAVKRTLLQHYFPDMLPPQDVNRRIANLASDATAYTLYASDDARNAVSRAINGIGIPRNPIKGIPWLIANGKAGAQGAYAAKIPDKHFSYAKNALELEALRRAIQYGPQAVNEAKDALRKLEQTANPSGGLTNSRIMPQSTDTWGSNDTQLIPLLSQFYTADKKSNNIGKAISTNNKVQQEAVARQFRNWLLQMGN